MIRSRTGTLLICLTLILLPFNASATEEKVRDQVSFQVEVGRDVENDRAMAVMYVTAEDKRAAGLADAINQAMSWALQQALANNAVTSRSGTYQTYPVYDEKKIVRWRGRQELQLESEDVGQLSQLIGILQSRLQIQSMRFTVSPERRQKVEDTLIEQAMKGFQARAEIVRKSLGAKGYELREVSIRSSARPPEVPLRAEGVAMMHRAAVQQPGLESGTSHLSIVAAGSIRLIR